MIGRADIEESKSNVAMNAWLPQASYKGPQSRRSKYRQRVKTSPKAAIKIYNNFFANKQKKTCVSTENKTGTKAKKQKKSKVGELVTPRHKQKRMFTSRKSVFYYRKKLSLRGNETWGNNRIRFGQGTQENSNRKAEGLHVFEVTGEKRRGAQMSTKNKTTTTN
jgi:hypothetical protein